MMPRQDSVTVGMHEEATYVIGAGRVEDFARASDDFAPHHLDELFASTSPLGGRVVHGVLLLGFVSAVSSRLLERVTSHYVTTGYDRVRFKLPVMVGDEVIVRYDVLQADSVSGTSASEFAVLRSDGGVCCFGRHLMKRLVSESQPGLAGDGGREWR